MDAWKRFEICEFEEVLKVVESRSVDNDSAEAFGKYDNYACKKGQIPFAFRHF